jgi:hypothetical protein
MNAPMLSALEPSISGVAAPWFLAPRHAAKDAALADLPQRAASTVCGHLPTTDYRSSSRSAVGHDCLSRSTLGRSCGSAPCGPPLPGERDKIRRVAFGRPCLPLPTIHNQTPGSYLPDAADLLWADVLLALQRIGVASGNKRSCGVAAHNFQGEAETHGSSHFLIS